MNPDESNDSELLNTNNGCMTCSTQRIGDISIYKINSQYFVLFKYELASINDDKLAKN